MFISGVFSDLTVEPLLAFVESTAISEKCYLLICTLIKLTVHRIWMVVIFFFFIFELFDAGLEDDDQQTGENAFRRWLQIHRYKHAFVSWRTHKSGRWHAPQNAWRSGVTPLPRWSRVIWGSFKAQHTVSKNKSITNFRTDGFYSWVILIVAWINKKANMFLFVHLNQWKSEYEKVLVIGGNEGNNFSTLIKMRWGWASCLIEWGEERELP